MMTSEPVLLVGAGSMAVEYSRVLRDLGCPMKVFGRGETSAAVFAERTGVTPTTGPVVDQIDRADSLPTHAIIAVNAMALTEVTSEIARAGVRRILVEKPAALDTEEMRQLEQLVRETGVEIRIGYNRRYLASVRAARQMIEEDGGPLSVSFDFSEPSRRISQLGKPTRELDTWFYGNSLHVVDLAFHLAGDCVEPRAMTAGGVSWHPAAGAFVGHGVTTTGALMSWRANWMGPGRWGVEVVTAQRRLILQPIERLRVQDHNSFDEHNIDLDLALDTDFKPGVHRQVSAFLTGENDGHLADLSEQARRWPSYEAIRTGADLGRARHDQS